jgi:Holliday junction resolvase RusA-like endonuclease
MNSLKEVIHGVCPSKSNCYRVSKFGGLFKTKALTEYEKKFYIQCRNRGKMIVEYFEIEVDVYYPNERADLDNSLKATMDCLQHCKVIKDDRKCVKITARKFLDKVNPRIELTITEIKLN